jgi:hypothetical protein
MTLAKPCIAVPVRQRSSASRPAARVTALPLCNTSSRCSRNTGHRFCVANTQVTRCQVLQHAHECGEWLVINCCVLGELTPRHKMATKDVQKCRLVDMQHAFS